MRTRFALVVAASFWSGLPSAGAETLRFAFPSDIHTLDPHSLNQGFTLAYLGNVYEGLVRRTPDLAIEPALAERWEMLEPTRWRFHLRKGVTFHDGSPFTAADVLFSFERARTEASQVKSRLAGVVEAVAVDDHTVDFVTEVPNPTIFAEWDSWYIMDEEWTRAHKAEVPRNGARPARRVDHADLFANGTGPFRVVERRPDERTVAVPWEGWWDRPTHNLTEVVFRPILSDEARTRALLDGEIDVDLEVDFRRVERIWNAPDVRVESIPGLRTIFLGMDQHRAELLHANVKGANPFRDRRVRQAFHRAIDVEALARDVMRGQAVPATALVAPGVHGAPEGLERLPYDPEAARRLLAEAGYPDGFEVTLDCPNDRWLNDEAICRAVAEMLGAVGVRVNVQALPNARFFAKVLANGGYDTSFYLFGWAPATLDSYHPLRDLAHGRDGALGLFNVGGYRNPELDALIDRILVETDPGKRDALIARAWRILHEDVAYLPLHRTTIVWGVRKGVEVAQRPDNQFLWRFVRVD